ITNAGTFLPGDTRTAVEMDRPPIHYRNGCLMNALYKMGFVETAGGGIMRMCMSQAERGFPMPDYRSDGLGVELTIHGKSPTGPYSEILRRNPELSALEIVDLDYVRMGRTIPKLDERSLESKGLVRRTAEELMLADPEILSRKTANYAGVKAIRPMIIEIIGRSGESTKKELFDAISSSIDGDTKKIYNDVTNALSSLRKEGVIENIGTNRLPVYRMKAHGHE
ncbi:MAG: ATP-binding protein, partial [Candidatus Methanomethylophilaceae archaeon]